MPVAAPPPPAATAARSRAAADPRTLLDDLMTARGPALRLYALACLSDGLGAGGTGRAAAADDAVQTAFLRLARRLARDSEPPADPAGWLFRTVRNLAKDARRDAARRARRERAAARPDWFRPAAALDDAFDAAAVAAALDGLPDGLREPVVLRLWVGRTFAEVGDLLDCSASAAQCRYGRGLDRLREALGN